MRVLRGGKAGWTATGTLEEERQEALESVLAAMAAESDDPAHAEACRYLVEHLTAGSEIRVEDRSGASSRPLVGREWSQDSAFGQLELDLGPSLRRLPTTPVAMFRACARYWEFE